MADLYRVGDTPNYEVDIYQVAGFTPVTPTGPVAVTVYNRQTGGTLAGAPVTTITGNRVIVVLPASPFGATAGDYRASTSIQIDGTPTVKTWEYDYSVQAATTT